MNCIQFSHVVNLVIRQILAHSVRRAHCLSEFQHQLSLLLSESILNVDPHILSAVMFGRGQFNAGVVIDPRPEFKFDPKDVKALSDFRNKIWYVQYYFIMLPLSDTSP